MIEFYYKYFKKNYRTKVKELILDITKLLKLEKIEIIDHYKIILNVELSRNIDKENWKKINQLYCTINKNRGKVSETLQNFVNKTQKKKKYSLIDTFAGCGGLSLGLEQAGFNPVFVNEIEAKFLETYYFNRTLQLDNYFCGDIKELVNNFDKFKEKFNNIDLFVGGPPCQGFSMANRQRIINDPRNKLYKQYLELLRSTYPKFFIMENVKGMINKADEIKKNFIEKIGYDYSIEIIKLNAKEFGIPQNRERVFVIGSRIKKAPATLIVSEINDQKKNKDVYKLKDALLGLPQLKPKTQKNLDIENEEIGYKLKLYEHNETQFEKYINLKKTKYVFNHINRYNNQRDIEIFSRLPQGKNSLHHSIKDIMPYKTRNHIFKDKYYKLDETQVSKTITSHMKYDCNMYIHPTQARGLSPREAARIQTFPDNFLFMGSNNNWYAQIGNAVPVKLAEIIGRQIIKHL